MRLLDATIIANQEVMPGVRLLRLAAPTLAAGAHPGQLILLRGDSGPHPALRVALPLHHIGRGEVSVLVATNDEDTRALAHCRPGEVVCLQGPIGQGFRVAPASRNLLLAAQDLGVAPLVALAESALAGGLAVTLLAGAPTAADLLPPALIPAEVEYRVATADGSLGRRGSVLDLLAADGDPPPLLWADQVFAAGSPGLYAGLSAAIAATRLAPEPGFAQGMLAGTLGCGLGACLGCAIETRRGVIYLCKQGPVIDLREMIL